MKKWAATVFDARENEKRSGAFVGNFSAQAMVSFENMGLASDFYISPAWVQWRMAGMTSWPCGGQRRVMIIAGAYPGRLSFLSISNKSY